MGVQTYIDGVEVTSSVLTGTSTRRLNLTSTATIRMPQDEAVGECGSRLKVVDDDYGLHFHGMVQTISDEGDEDTLYSEYVAADPTELWQWRPARDGVASGDAGDFSNPDFMSRLQTAPQIMQEILEQSEDLSQGPDDAEGPLFIELGTVETGGVDVSGAPVDWPMTIAEIANLLVSTGELDIVVEPIDYGGNMALVHLKNGAHGSDLSGSLSFDYAMGSHNVRQMRRVEDLSNVCNKLWYYIGPRVGTRDDPDRLQHWEANVQADAPLPDPPATDVVWKAALSRGTYGTRMEIKIFDARGDEIDALDLYHRLWLLESWIRADPRTMVHFTPVRGTELNFDVGDLVTVRAGSKFRGGFSGAQRIYAYTLGWDSEGVTEITDIQTSPSQEGI